MAGKIRTREKCPDCGGKFKDFNSAMVCEPCMLKGRLNKPKRYYLDIPYQGKCRIFSDNNGVPLKIYDLAKHTLLEITDRIKKKTFNPEDYRKRDIKKIQFASYAKRWLEICELQLKKGLLAPTTLQIHQNAINKYAIPFFGDRDLRDITKGHINDFYLWLPAKLKPNTQKGILKVLLRLINYAESRDEIKTVPKFPKIKVVKEHAGWIDRATQDLILNHIKPGYHRAIFEFMVNTGCRPGEARALHVEDFDQTKGEVTIHRTFSDNILMNRTKTKRVRTIPLDEPTHKLLSNIKKTTLAGLFFRVKGSFYNLDRVSKIWRKAVKRAGLPHIKLKNGTRHSFICQKLNEGESIKLVGEYVGHSAVEMTEVYSSVNVEALRVLLKGKGKVERLRDGISKGN
jgi:integrase